MESGISYERVCAESEVAQEGAMKCVSIPSTSRSVMLIRSRGKLYCMDQACYHHGGPLLNGDIEDYGGKLTIKCPWHSYRLALESGEGLYMGIVPAAGGKMSQELKSKGIKQRVHSVVIRDDGFVYVADSSKAPDATSIESDVYAHQEQTIYNKSDIKVKIHSNKV